MKILIEESVLRQALEALEKTMPVFNGTCAWHADVDNAITALRSTLDTVESLEAENAKLHAENEKYRAALINLID